MATIADLRDSRIFPDFKTCPQENEMDLDFYTFQHGYMLVPKRHWCLLAEIVDVGYFIRLRLIVKDKSGHEFPVAFYTDDKMGGFDVALLKKGHTIMILYAHQHYFLDFTIGIRVEEFGSTKVSYEQ
jgi:hypothetical protein